MHRPERGTASQAGRRRVAGQGEADAQRLQDASRSGAGVHQLVQG